MSEWNGWAGTILDVNLSTGKIKKESLSREWAVKYVGGRCLAARILYDEVGPETDPLGPDNIIIVSSGPLGGTLAPASGRYELASKSPLIGIYGASNGGGFFGPELKWAGYDLIIIRGMSQKPVYIWIDDDDVEIREASHIWGQDTLVTEQMIREELCDPEIKTLKIGPAGEHLCLSSCVIGDLSRAAGRQSIGAVWGSKKLKAIAVRGSKGVNIAKPRELEKLCRKLNGRAREDPMYETQTVYGTVGWVWNPMRNTAIAPNCSPEAFDREVFDKHLACFNCDLHCGHYYTVKEGKYKGTTGEGPEAPPLVTMTGYGNTDNPAFICAFNTLCNKLGLNNFLPGDAITWAMNLYRQGIITKEQTGGIELKWGDEEAILKLTRMMAYKEGFGEVLDGFPRRMIETLGLGGLYMPETKGVASRYSGIVRSLNFTLAWSTATRGGDHLVGVPTMRTTNRAIRERMGKERYGDPKLFISDPWTISGKEALLVYDYDNRHALPDMTGVCKFRGAYCLDVTGLLMQDFADLLFAVTGVNFTPDDLVKAASRQNLLQRAFNAREGIRRIDDYPYPYRWQLEHNMEQHPGWKWGKLPVDVNEYGKLIDEYYKLRGCDIDTGIPTRKKLEELDLKDVADDLDKRGILPATK